MNAVWGNLALLFLFHTFIWGFFWLRFSCIGSKVQIIVGFGDFSPASLTKKSGLDKMPANGGGKAPTDFEKLLLVCQRTSKKCFILWWFQRWGNHDSLNQKSRWILAHTFVQFLYCYSIAIWLWIGHCWDKAVWKCAFPPPRCHYRLPDHLKFYFFKKSVQSTWNLKKIHLEMGSTLSIRRCIKIQWL